MVKTPSYIIEVVEYTDSYCTWCWGSEPILRKIKEVYGDQVRITYKMGGLVEDVTTFYDPLNRIGGEKMFEQVAEHWVDASSRHGMPVDSQVFQDMAGEFQSTYPANIAYKAAQMQSKQLADIFLRRIREAIAAERRLLHKRKVQIELAQEVGLDKKMFVDSLENGSAEKAFQEDFRETKGLGISGFPTFHIKNKRGEGIFLRGYQRFETFEKAFRKLTRGDLVKNRLEANNESILSFVEKYRKVATREVAKVFDLTDQQAVEILTTLESKEKIERVKVGNGYFWISMNRIKKI